MAGKRSTDEVKTKTVVSGRSSTPVARTLPRKSSTKKAAPKKSSKRSQRPPRAVRLSQAERRYQQPAIPRRPGVSVTVNIAPPKLPAPVIKFLGQLRLPPAVAVRLASASARLPKLPPRLWPYQRHIMTVVVVLVLGTAGFALFAGQGTPAVTGGKVSAAGRTAPDFKPLVPSATEASATTYDGKRNLVTYSSTFSGARLTVSQQPLPARFLSDPKALAAAADSIQAKQQLDTAVGPLYIATNDTNDQLAIFAGKKVLLFVHTDRKLDDTSWKSFIELLKEK